MTDSLHVRTFAMSLPEVAEQPHFESASFRVRGKIFVSLPPGGCQLHAFVSDDETHAFVAEDPASFEELWWGKTMWGVRVNLAHAKPVDVEELIESAWRRKAPKRVVAAFDAGQSTR
jgi:hypothetical protein